MLKCYKIVQGMDVREEYGDERREGERQDQEGWHWAECMCTSWPATTKTSFSVV